MSGLRSAGEQSSLHYVLASLPWCLPWLRGYMNERDLGRAKLGAKARLTGVGHPMTFESIRLSPVGCG